MVENASLLFWVKSWLIHAAVCLLSFVVLSDSSGNNKHSRNFVWCLRIYVSMVIGLLHANCKENLMTRFANKQNQFKRAVYICWHCHGNGIYVSLIIKTLKFVLLTCLLPFLVTKGSRYQKLCSATWNSYLKSYHGENRFLVTHFCTYCLNFERYPS